MELPDAAIGWLAFFSMVFLLIFAVSSELRAGWNGAISRLVTGGRVPDHRPGDPEMGRLFVKIGAVMLVINLATFFFFPSSITPLSFPLSRSGGFGSGVVASLVCLLIGYNLLRHRR